jgi:hypothetical protein
MNDDSDSTGVAGKTIDMQGEAAGSVSEATLIARHTANALRRRTLLAAGTTLVKRDPKDVAGAIALGFVLRGRGLGAADSWRLDGLLSGSVDELTQRLTEAARHLPGGDAGAVLVRAIDLAAGELAARGEYTAWKRRADRYFEEHDAWLAADEEMRLTGAWRRRRMTMGQQDLIRATCALWETDLPGHLLRGSAHDWLDAARANLRYKGLGA